MGALYSLTSYMILACNLYFTGQIDIIMFIWVGKPPRGPASAPAKDNSKSATVTTLEGSSKTFMVISPVS